MLGINVHVVILRHVAVPHTHIWTGESRHCSRFHQYIDLIQEIESHLAEVPACISAASVRERFELPRRSEPGVAARSQRAPEFVAGLPGAARFSNAFHCARRSRSTINLVGNQPRAHLAVVQSTWVTSARFQRMPLHQLLPLHPLLEPPFF